MCCRFTHLSTLVVLSAVLLYSCSNSQATAPPPDPQTERFANYLRYNFDDSIPNAPHVYILIARKDARENISKLLLKMRPQLLAEDARNYSSIISAAVPIADSLLPKGSIKTDWDGAIDKLILPLSGITIIQTRDHKIVKLFQASDAVERNESVFFQ